MWVTNIVLAGSVSNLRLHKGAASTTENPGNKNCEQGAGNRVGCSS